MFSKKFFILATFLLPAISAPSPLLTIPRTANSIPDRHIITLKKGVSRAAHVNTFQSKRASSPSNITHEWDIINGYAGHFSPEDLEGLRAHPDVASIEHDAIVRGSEIVTQNGAPWGLARISSRERLEKSTGLEYKYDSTAGSGVTVYVMDTGILVDHPAFGGRASWGKTFGGYPNRDDNGHGTHCAGIAVSGLFGVSKSANVVAVKVFDHNILGQVSDIISGAQWIMRAVQESKKPAVVSMSFDTSVFEPLDQVVRVLYEFGITVVVAAGNGNTDAINSSPARTEEAITVGASTFGDERAEFSNFGSSIDIFAPGMNILSAWNNYGYQYSNGTSMAAPHVGGYAAYLLGIDSSLTPASVASTIINGALVGALTGIPPGTPNRLLNNGL